MGEIYRARDPEVAIKVIAPALSGRQAGAPLSNPLD
jgi:hypothetical protein